MEDKNDGKLGEVRVIGSKEVGSSPEEKMQAEEDLNERIREAAQKKARLTILKTFQTQLRQIQGELETGKTFDDVLTEINEKRSRLSRATRDFCINFEKEAIIDLVKDLDLLKHGKVKV